MNRSLLLTTLSTLLLMLPGEEALTWRLGKGATLVRHFESTVKAELQSVTIKVDGEQQEGGPEVEMTIGSEFAYEFSDEIEDAEDGGPTKIVRTFVDIGGNRSRSVKVPERDVREDTSELETELEGKRVVLERKGSSWTAKWAEDDEKTDAKLLEGLDGDVDLRAFLPDKSVSEGDTWSVEPSAFKNLQRPSGRLSRHGKGEDPAEQNRFEAMLDDSIDGKITAKFSGVREEGGVRVAVIAINAELRVHGTQEIDGGEAGQIKNEIALSYTLEGEILWETSAGFAQSASLGGSVDRTQTEHRTIETPDGAHELEQTFTFSGDVIYKARNERK
ncbi:MAG TPA: hypothetical protein VM509_08745 [Planctomycetota bacterium]|nr:hypothetical protein [Planctomycetota bacterium]